MDVLLASGHNDHLRARLFLEDLIQCTESFRYTVWIRRQAEIERDGAVPICAKRCVCGATVGDQVDREPLLLEPRLDRFAEQAVVFGDQYAHELRSRWGGCHGRAAVLRAG